MTIETIHDILQRMPSVIAAYESPAEESLGERLRPAVSPSASFQTQVWVNTFAGRFRLDMLLTDCKGRRIAVEVDGKDFHNPTRDRWRTVFIIGDGQADVLYRVPARDLKRNLVGVLAGLAASEPQCFNNASVLEWKEATTESWRYSDAGNDEYDDDDDDIDPSDAEDARRYRGRWIGSSAAIEGHYRGDALDCTWEAIRARYEFAKSTGLVDLDAIERAWKLKNAPAPDPNEEKILSMFDFNFF
jgi:very-short-patch-repair endonuclease